MQQQTVEMTFARGDSFLQGFQLRYASDNEEAEEIFDDIYFTVKKKFWDRDFIFQKRLSTGGIEDDGYGHYTIRIEPSDTDGLPFGTYSFDIQLARGNDYRKTYAGILKLTEESTHSYNE